MQRPSTPRRMPAPAGTPLQWRKGTSAKAGLSSLLAPNVRIPLEAAVGPAREWQDPEWLPGGWASAGPPSPSHPRLHPTSPGPDPTGKRRETPALPTSRAPPVRAPPAPHPRPSPGGGVSVLPPAAPAANLAERVAWLGAARRAGAVQPRPLRGHIPHRAAGGPHCPSWRGQQSARLLLSVGKPSRLLAGRRLPSAVRRHVVVRTVRRLCPTLAKGLSKQAGAGS
jgi:hypothetical protein